jgi:hypothetical protein
MLAFLLFAGSFVNIRNIFAAAFTPKPQQLAVTASPAYAISA